MNYRNFIAELLKNSKSEDGKNILDFVFDMFGERGVQKLKDAADEELAKHPKIAIIGKTGVGKSSTINSLFGTNLQVSHVEACTKEEHEVSLLTGKEGKIILYDMPGLGEDIDADEKHKETYRKVLSDCDVGLWVIKADTRDIAYDQSALRDVISKINPQVAERLVIGINQVDLIQPGEWVEEFNYPSEEQLSSIELKIEDVRKKITKVCSTLKKERIIPYSATKRFRLEHLFATMIEACAYNRSWVLNSRKSLSDFTELITDPEIKEFVKNKQMGMN